MDKSTEINRVLSNAGRRVRLDAKKRFGGDGAKAGAATAEQVKALVRRPEILEEWATEQEAITASSDLSLSYTEMMAVVDGQETKRDNGKGDDKLEHLTREWLSLWYMRELEALEYLKPFRFSDYPDPKMQTLMKQSLAVAYLAAGGAMVEEREAG